MKNAQIGKHLAWEFPKGLFVVLFFLVYVNDLLGNVICDINLFADDTSLFSVVTDEARTALEFNHKFERVSLWAWQWKMQFNAERQKK